MSILSIIASGGRTSPLDIAEAKGKGAKDASQLATEALGRKVKHAELEEWLDTRGHRETLRGAEGMKAEEFVGEDARDMRSEERKLSKEQASGKRKMLPSEIAMGIQKNMQTMHKMDVEDMFYRTQSITEDTTQAEYNKIRKDMPQEYADTLGLTGSLKDDLQKIQLAQVNAINNLPHLRNMQINAAKAAAGANKKTLKTPAKPPQISDVSQIMIKVEKDQDILSTDAWYSWNAPSKEAFVNDTQVQANSILVAEHNKAIQAADKGQHYVMKTPEQAIDEAIFFQKAMLHDGNAEGIEYLSADEAEQQYRRWSVSEQPRLAQQVKGFNTKTGVQKQVFMRKLYEAYMTDRYNRKLIEKREAEAYGQ